MTEKITKRKQIKNERLIGLFSANYNQVIGLWVIHKKGRTRQWTWVYLRLRLARPYVNLRWLVLTLVEIKFARTSTHVFRLLLANEIQDMSASRVYLWRNLAVRLATQRKSLRKFNLPLFATTCDSVWLYTKVGFP